MSRGPITSRSTATRSRRATQSAAGLVANDSRRSHHGSAGSRDSIYANRIDTDEIQGQIHQSKDVKVGETRGEIKAPEVTASIIYAEEISAISVVAHNVYVRDLRRR